MGGNGKHRWKISFHRSNSSSKQPPKEFICHISGSLMSDPVIVASDQTFERRSVQVCREFGYAPKLPDGIRFLQFNSQHGHQDHHPQLVRPQSCQPPPAARFGPCREERLIADGGEQA
ncbi:hypothetical protein ACLB2K_007942 [Fragaria x ananassa]